MIRVAERNGSLVMTGGLEPGTVAYVDADWVGAGVGELPALVFPADAGDSEAATALRAFARRAAEHVPDDGLEGVEVVGRGFAADEVRRLLAERGARPIERKDGRPRAIVELTGDPQAIDSALERLDVLGTLVLAGHTGDRPFPINLYRDLHLRAQRIIGVPEPTTTDGSDAPGEGASGGTPAQVRLDAPVGPGSWYRIESNA